MLKRIDLRGTNPSNAELLALVPRAGQDVNDVIPLVEPILANVREHGEAALREYSQKFDAVAPASFRVSSHAISEALESISDEVRAGLEEAIRRVREFHVASVPPPVEVEVAPGAKLKQKWIPVRRVGLYVPGGLAVYPSSVVMNVVTAQAAGVTAIAVTSPPQREFGGLPHPTILAACALLGIDEVYAVGGAQAIGMLAYGVSGLVEPVDVITGPGNVFVTSAKRLVNGVVRIDAEAGPTEIAVVADAQANARYVAADMLSQAEHDPLAGSVLITDSEVLANAVDAELAILAAQTKHAARVAESLGGTQSAIVLTSSLEQSIEVADAYGAEHLEIHTENAHDVAEQIRNAGAIFIGGYSPVPLGDYIAGSNHVLPTGGTARFASGLGVTSFLKAVTLIDYNREALAEVAPKLVALAQAEDLPAHGDAVTERFV